jgi:hypothetical protein
MAISSRESMADAKTATEPEAIPIVSLTINNIVATEDETTVAFFWDDICFSKGVPIVLIDKDYNMQRVRHALPLENMKI